MLYTFFRRSCIWQSFWPTFLCNFAWRNFTYSPEMALDWV